MRLSVLFNSPWKKWILLFVLIGVAALWISPVSASAASDWFDKGSSFINAGRYDEALTALNKAIELDPNYANAWYGKGYAFFLLGRYNEALAAFNKAIELEPNHAGAWNGKGVALYNLGRHDEALAACNKAIELNPNYADAWKGKGDALYYLGRDDEALAAYNKAIELDPNFAMVWYNKGGALYNLGRYNDALVAYNKAIELNPNFAVVWYNKGGALVSLGRFDEALIAFNKAIELDPNYAAAWNNKGGALEDLGRYDEALAAYNKAIELDPNYARAKTNRDALLSKLSQGTTTIVTTPTTPMTKPTAAHTPVITTSKPTQTPSPQDPSSFNPLFIIGIILLLCIGGGGYYFLHSRKTPKGREGSDSPQPQNGTIYAESIPSGAKIYIEGTYVGISPVTIRNVRPGDHTLEAKLNGYDSNVQRITINPGQTGLYSPDLKKLPLRSIDPWEELVLTCRKGQQLTLFAKPIKLLCDNANKQYIQGNIVEAKRLLMEAELEIDRLKTGEEKIQRWKKAGYDTSTLESLNGLINSNLIYLRLQDYEEKVSRLEKIEMDLQELNRQYPDEFKNPEIHKAVELFKVQSKNPLQISDIEAQYALIRKKIEQISGQRNKQIQVQINRLTEHLGEIRNLGIDIQAFIKRAKSQDFERNENDLKEMANTGFSVISDEMDRMQKEGIIFSRSVDEIHNLIEDKSYAWAIVNSGKKMSEISALRATYSKAVQLKNKLVTSPVIALFNAGKYEQFLKDGDEILALFYQCTRLSVEAKPLGTIPENIPTEFRSLTKEQLLQTIADLQQFIQETKETKQLRLSARELYEKVGMLGKLPDSIPTEFQSLNKEQLLKTILALQQFIQETEETKQLRLSARELYEKAGMLGKLPEGIPTNNDELDNLNKQSLERVISELEKYLKTAKPELTLSLDRTQLSAEKWYKLGITLANTGLAHAENVAVAFSSEVEIRGIKPISVKAGESSRMEIRILPKNAGNILLDVTLTYKDLKGKEYRIVQEISVDVIEKGTTSPIETSIPQIIRTSVLFGGYIRVKISVKNTTPLAITGVILVPDVDPAILHLERYEPEEYPLENERINLGTINPDNEKMVILDFEPLMCLNTDVNCHVRYKDAQGQPRSLNMQPLRIQVVCPSFETKEPVNIGMLKQLIEDLPLRDSKVFSVPNNLDAQTQLTLVRSIIQLHDVRHISTLKRANNFESWYYGKTKVTQKNMVIKIGIVKDDDKIEITAYSDDLKNLTGLLAEIGQHVTEKISKLGPVQKIFNVTIKDSVVQRTNLMSFCDAEGKCSGDVTIEDSVVMRSNIG